MSQSGWSLGVPLYTHRLMEPMALCSYLWLLGAMEAENEFGINPI